MGNSNIVPDFIQIPAPVLLADIPPSHKILFGYIYWYTKLAMQKCTASNETLGKLAGLNAGGVSNAISALKQAGFVSVEYDGDTRSKNTKRVINSLISYKNHVPLNNGTRKQGYVPLNNGTGAMKIVTKEEYIKRNRKDLVNEKGGKPVEKSEMKLDVRGSYSPAKEKIRKMFEAKRMGEQLNLTGG